MIRTSLLALSIAMLPGLAQSGPADETADDAVRDLYSELVATKAHEIPSDGAEIGRRISDSVAGISERQAHSGTGGLAVEPEISPDMIVGADRPEDILMDPRILDALARMPDDRAAEILEMIRTRKSGRDPLAALPSMSASLSGGTGGETASDPAENLFLRDWSLVRNDAGAPALVRANDPASLIEIHEGMVLGAFGRVETIQDGPSSFLVRLESGDTIVGSPRDEPEEVTISSPRMSTAGGVPAPEKAPRADAGGNGAARDAAPAVSLRPRARPDAAGESAGAAVADMPDIRPVPRPANLTTQTRDDGPKDQDA